MLWERESKVACEVLAGRSVAGYSLREAREFLMLCSSDAPQREPTRLDEIAIRRLKQALQRGAFPGLTFEHCKTFLLNGGIMPADALPLQSLLSLDAWAERSLNLEQTSVFTSTQLKNETGRVIREARDGKRVLITRHGRPLIAITKAN